MVVAPFLATPLIWYLLGRWVSTRPLPPDQGAMVGAFVVFCLWWIMALLLVCLGIDRLLRTR